MGKIVSALKKTGNLIASNHLRQKIFLICVLALFSFVYVAFFAPPDPQLLPAYDVSSQRTQQALGNAPQEMPLHMNEGYPIGLVLYFAPPKYETTDQYTIEIMDSAGKDVFTNYFSASSLADDKYKLQINLTNMPKKGGEYTLQITGKDITPETAVSIYTRTSAGTIVPEAAVSYSMGISPYVLSLSFVTVLAGCILILFYSKKLNVNILATILVFGVLFALLTPIMDVPDEAVHTGKAFMVAGGTLFNTPGGGTVSMAVSQITHDTGVATHNQTLLNTVLLGQGINPAHTQSTLGSIEFFLGYLPAALVINICQLLHTSVLTLFYAGRIINLVIYAICAFFAIRIAPRYKLFFGVIAAAPMVLFIAASYNGDYLTYGLSLLLAALFTRFYFKKDYTITYKEIIWFSVICAIACIIKQNLLPLCFLLLFIPKARFASGKSKLYGVLISVAIPMIATLGILGLTFYGIGRSGITSSIVGNALNSSGANAGQQLHFILSSVTSSGAILIRAFVNNASGYIAQLLTFGWLSYSPPTVFAYLYAGFIALVGFVYSKYEYNAEGIVETKHTTINKLGILLLLALSYIAINLIQYLIITPVGANFIDGVQGRYLIPLMLLMPFLSSNKGPQIDEDAYLKKQNYILFTAQAFVILSILQTIFQYY